MDKLWVSLQGIPNLLIVMTFLFFLCLVEGIFLFVADSDRQHKKRLQKRLKYIDKLEKRFTQESLLKADGLSGQPWMRRALKKVRQLGQIQTLLQQADVNLPLGMFLLIWLISGALGLSLAFFHRGRLGGTGGVGPGIAFALPHPADEKESPHQKI